MFPSKQTLPENRKFENSSGLLSHPIVFLFFLQDCMYLHEVGDSEASFTKDDMAAKKHEEYERKVCDQIMSRINLKWVFN